MDFDELRHEISTFILEFFQIIPIAVNMAIAIALTWAVLPRKFVNDHPGVAWAIIFIAFCALSVGVIALFSLIPPAYRPRWPDRLF